MESKNIIFFGAIFLCAVILSEQARINVFEIQRKQVFDIAVLRSQKPVVAYFTKPSCGKGICARIQNDLEQIAREHNDILTLAIIDLEKYPEMKDQLEIKNIPTTRAYYKGNLEGQVKGPVWNSIKRMVDKLLEDK